ncbi:hypothetical protein Tco_1118020 [Tanacetum coccineum]
MAEEIEKLVKGTENVEEHEVDSSTLRQDDNQNDPGTRLEPRSNKESPEVEITVEVQPVNVNEEEEESADDDYELRRRFKGKEELTVNNPPPSSSTPSSSSSKLSATNRLLSLFMPRMKFSKLAQHLQEIMEEALPKMVDDQVKELTKTQVPVDSSVRNYMSGHILHVHPTQAALASAQEQQYQLYLNMRDNPLLQQDDLPIWLALKYKFEKLHVSNTHFVQSFQRDPKAPALSMVNQDLLYLKKGNSGPEKIVMSLYKFPAVIFPDDDIEERTSRWVDKSVKKFNPYARYSVEHWKNPHAKIFYINRQREPEKPKEAIYSNSKIFQIVKTYWELGHGHKFVTKIIARRENGSIVSITEQDYKNLNKNDIEDMYLLIVNDKVDDYAETKLPWSLSVFIKSTVIWERVHDLQLGVERYQQKVNLTAPTITFPGIEKYKMFSIVSEPVVLEGLKSYNNNVNYGYVTLSLSKEDAKYLQLFEEEIEERLKHRDHMIRWKMYVNGRPLGSRRERPE